jgi:peptide deformylase
MAANMIGVRKNILVAQMDKKYLIMVNPKIVDHSKQYYDVEEVCLSLPGKRPGKCKQKFLEIMNSDESSDNYKLLTLSATIS